MPVIVTDMLVSKPGLQMKFTAVTQAGEESVEAVTVATASMLAMLLFQLAKASHVV